MYIQDRSIKLQILILIQIIVKKLIHFASLVTNMAKVSRERMYVNPYEFEARRSCNDIK